MLEMVMHNRAFLAEGILSTLALSALSIVFGTALAVVLALIRYMRVPVLSRLCALYVGLIQGAPLLVVLLVCYFAIPALLGYKTSAYSATILSFTVFIAPYLAEDIRGGLDSVRPSLIAAALATGLTPRQVIRLIVLPIALRSVIPTLINQYVRLIKFTSVASIIGTQELTGNALLINARIFEPIPVLAFVALVYLFICQIVSLTGRWLYARWAVRT
jgi:His/Glu/Gln/Arg/opine family amino acid ABC transporter permease subunit